MGVGSAQGPGAWRRALRQVYGDVTNSGGCSAIGANSSCQINNYYDSPRHSPSDNIASGSTSSG